jgi:hypothetical protein
MYLAIPSLLFVEFVLSHFNSSTPELAHLTLERGLFALNSNAIVKIMYKPSYLFDRTPEQKRDILLSWDRDDQAFFASGACHILADLFVQLHQVDGFKTIHIKPAEGFPGNHVFASNGVWAFDHNGWTKEDELLSVTEKAYVGRYRDWSYEKIILEPSMTSLEDFCKENNHRLPWQYAHLPWERARKYIDQFSPTPPDGL